METALVISDLHYPFIHKPSVEIAKKVCKDVKPNHVVYGGDCFDAEGISRFSEKTVDKGIEDTIKEIAGFKKLHEEFVKLAPKAQFYWCGGNHDTQRIDKLLKKLEDKEQYSKLRDCEYQFDLKRIFPDVKICGYNEFHKIGKIKFTHGEYCNDAAAKKHATAWSGNVVFFHTHTLQQYTLRQQGDYPSQAITMGCMCTHKPDYMNNKSHGWIHCLGVVYFQPNGAFNLYPIQIHSKKAIFNGKLYEV